MNLAIFGLFEAIIFFFDVYAFGEAQVFLVEAASSVNIAVVLLSEPARSTTVKRLLHGFPSLLNELILI